MRRTIEILTKRVLKSRWGIALVIAVLVLGVVGGGRLFADGDTGTPLVESATAAPTISADPNDHEGVVASEPPPTIRTSPGTAAPEAVAYAFASAWVHHRGMSAQKWYAGLLPHATQELAGSLKGVDPEKVPADRITGRPDLVPVGDGLAEAVVAADTGKLRLRLTAPDGHWLVDSIDWEQS
jgi:hypothetical protein